LKKRIFSSQLAEAIAQPGWVGAGPAGISYRQMAVDESDSEDKGYVLWKSWQETYLGMVDSRYLAELTIDKGEISALYLLGSFQGRGIGKTLIELALAKLKDDSAVIVWVLADHKKAIGFFESCGFFPDGGEKYLDLGTSVRCIRMIKKN